MLRGKQTMLWDISKAGRQTKPVSIQKHRRLTAMGFRPGRNEFFTISSDGSVKRWNSATGQLLGPVFAKGVGSRQFAFSPDGLRIAFADNDQTVKVWDIAQGEMVFPPLRQRGAVRSIALTPDNRSILIGGLDGGIRLWDGATGEQLGPTLRHTAGIKSTAIRSDGRQILAASRLEFRAKLWRSPRPMSGKPELVRLQLEVDTGLELTDSGTARELSPKVWQQRQLRLRARTEASSGETESRNERDQL